MWADSLLVLERAHWLRVIVWAAASILAGTAILAWLRAGKRVSPLLQHFALQCAGWGCAEALLGLVLLQRSGVRDLASVTRLDRLLWLNIGLDCGYLMVGSVLIVLGGRLLRRPGYLGAGIGILVQGLALGVLDLALAAQISR